MKIAVFIRAVVAVLGFSLGYYLIGNVAKFHLLNVPFFSEIMVGVVVAGFAVYSIPWIGKLFTKLFIDFAGRVAFEVANQIKIPQMLDRFERPHFTEGKEIKLVNPMVLDTSAIIDGRIANIVDSGFLFGTLIVPRFVLSELQHIADSDDALRRNRGRRGFEVLDQLKKSKLVKLKTFDDKEIDGKNVDERILNLASKLKGKIITTDFNLNKVASNLDVKTLNVNELVNAIKSPMLPGEPIEVKVIQEGKEKDQGVGYLPDGTMIVVESGAQFVGKKIDAVVSRVLQTVAGRMIFVKATDSSRHQSPTH